MSLPRPKSRSNSAAPSPSLSRKAGTRSPATPKDYPEETFWTKVGTLGRKKKTDEVQEVENEGKHAIDSPGMPKSAEMPPEEYQLEENEERSMIEPKSFENPKFKELIKVLIDWVNDELHHYRIIVQDIEEDLYDGQILQKLMEKLTGQQLQVPEVTQTEDGQRNKLRIVLGFANHVLGLQRGQAKWSVDSVHTKNIVSILHLLVALARHFRAPIRLPEHVTVDVVIVTKRDGILLHRVIMEELTSAYDDLGLKQERDAFDTLFDHAPDKLQVVKKSLVTFVNKHLNKINLDVYDLDAQFSDGSFEEKVTNVGLAFELMQDGGLPKPKARPEDIVNLDLKSTLRVLYNLFTKYKHLS
ncbi:hypothetical protein TCAL_05117 [Tigriopus californicus]|uniref:Calponin-homology (CH) domain-containing protein n=1 Tax=Tigriopus californicus TaxID=6832 RepID=A0A553PNU3_TIGCA|nr:hypothetical protein TCAL_05117 [Tigriopus californicus]